MGRYLNDARHHLGEIEHFYKHAGFAGYSQAKYHWDELAELMQRAWKSKNDQADVVVIQGLMDTACQMMDEMKKRRDQRSDSQGRAHAE